MDIGDRMKLYEQNEAGRRLMPLLPALARIDGRSFHSFTRGLPRPYCERLHNLMCLTTQWLVEKTNALIGYTQSDEITLCWLQKTFESQIFFDGKIQKMVSQLGAISTLYFNKFVDQYLGNGYKLKHPTFDARVWTVPNLTEAANAFIWREQDATRNSIIMAALAQYSHNELHEKSCNEMQEMLHVKGVNWNDYPDWAKRGTFVKRVTEVRRLTVGEIEKLPEKHDLRSNPNTVVNRHRIVKYNLPVLTKIDNLQAVLFTGAEPILKS